MGATQYCLSMLRAKIRNFFGEENGAGEIIAAVVVIAIVIILGIAFQDRIKELFTNLWTSATSGAEGVGQGGGGGI